MSGVPVEDTTGINVIVMYGSLRKSPIKRVGVPSTLAFAEVTDSGGICDVPLPATARRLVGG